MNGVPRHSGAGKAFPRLWWILVAVLIGTQVAHAQTGAAQHDYDIPAGDLVRAVNRFSQQSDVQIIYDLDLLNGKTAPALKGRLPLRLALEKLLAGSGLGWANTEAGTIVLRAVSEPVQRNETRSRNKTQEALSEFDAITVTGSRLAGAAAEGPIPVHVYTHADIERSGQTTVSNFLATLSEVSVSTPEGAAVFAGQTTVRLRGLPMGTTLVLINGRRVENGGGTAFYGGYFDLNIIPAGTVERIEIVPEGSSAVYGSDALAGVVNIVLKQNFEGLQADVHYGGATGTSEAAADFAWGRRWEHGAFSVVGSYYGKGELSAAEREITAAGAFGLPTDYCNPGNVYSIDGSNLPGLNAPFANIRPGVNGKPSFADFDTSTSNACTHRQAGSSSDLIPRERLGSVFAYGHYELAPQVELFTELMYSRSTLDMAIGDPVLVKTILPASNAYNPFGEDVLVNYRFWTPVLRKSYDGSTDYARALVGARGSFSDAWEWEIAAWQTRDIDHYEQRAALVDPANLARALASPDPATALNLFSSGAPASDAVLESIYSSEFTRTTGQSQIVNGFVRGSPLDLPAGSVSMVFGGEYARNRLEWNDNSQATLNFSLGRRVGSLFGEARLPILASGGEGAARDLLAFNTALRYDKYSDFGSKVTPQYSLELRPAEGLFLRALYAKAFKAPGLVELYLPKVSYANGCCVADPLHGGQSTGFIQILGGNPQLKPETGQSKSIDVVWSPEAAQGLQISLSYWNIEQNNRTTQSISPQTFVDYPDLFPGRVLRDPKTGQIVSIDQSFVNFGSVVVSGVDYKLSYEFDSGAGRFFPSLGVTEVVKYRSEIVPGAPATDDVSRATQDAWAPRWKGTLALNWARGAYSASADARFVGSYVDYQDLGPTARRLGNFWICDLSAKYEFGKSPAAAYVRVGVVNLFNSLPAYSAFGYGERGFDPTQYDIRGRFVYVNVGTEF